MEGVGHDGSACDTGSDLVVEAESVFTKIVVKEADGGCLKVACWPVAKRRWRILGYIGLRTDYRNSEVTLLAGPTRAKQRLAAAILRLGCPGSAAARFIGTSAGSTTSCS